MKTPQKVQAGAIPDGWPGQNMALDGLSLLPAHFPKPLSPAPGYGVSLGIQLCPRKVHRLQQARLQRGFERLCSES